MNKKLLINKVRLSYFPMSAFVFDFQKMEEQFKKATEKSHIYFITQQPVLCFELENLEIIKNNILKINLVQIEHQAKHSINVEVDLFKYYALEENIFCSAELMSFDHHDIKPLKYHYLRILINGKHDYFTPERLLFESCKNGTLFRIKGNIKVFLNYDILYVGKAKNISKRLSNHSTLQKILSTRYSKDVNSMVSHEIKLLFFEFEDNIHIDSFNGNFVDKNEEEYFLNALFGIMPHSDKYYLDAEKVFINVFKPNYNVTTYENYPISKDGLFGENLDAYVYQFIDQISLICKNHKFEGHPDENKRDTISIHNNKKVRLYKAKFC